MYHRTEKLINELAERFGYTEDNNRDLLGDPMFSPAEQLDELGAQFAYRFLIEHLRNCDEATDRACWGD